MTVYSAVHMYEGIITDMKVFSNIEAARNYFHETIEEDGRVDDCDPDQYEDGKEGFFYWTDIEVCSRYSEIIIHKVEMED